MASHQVSASATAGAGRTAPEMRGLWLAFSHPAWAAAAGPWIHESMLGRPSADALHGELPADERYRCRQVGPRVVDQARSDARGLFRDDHVCSALGQAGSRQRGAYRGLAQSPITRPMLRRSCFPSCSNQRLPARLATLAGRNSLCAVTRARLGAIAFLHDIGKANRGFRARVDARADPVGHIDPLAWIFGPRRRARYVCAFGLCWVSIASNLGSRTTRNGGY